MLFNSLQFLVFFCFVYSLYLILPHRWQNRMLILASCVFYAAWNWKFLFLLFASVTTDFICSQYIFRSTCQSLRKKLLFLSIFVNLSILGFFKYSNFFIQNAQTLVNHFTPFHLNGALNIILPLGISFYTFEAISYTVDVYRGVTLPAKTYWNYVLFILYFPHLIAGPIMRAKDFMPQIYTPRKLNLNQFYEGTHLVFWGLFEKMFVADNLAKIVNPIFSSTLPYQGGSVLVATYAFAFQIFCDFDGYSNIARGLGKCIGFEITINFKLPYFATNPREFWQKWHISLSSWLKDYLYIPLGGNKESLSITYKNLLLTMLLGGLWHGASWTFIIWGAYHGILLICYRAKENLLFKGKPPSNPPVLEKIFKAIKIIFFFQLICLGWLIFRANSLHKACEMLHALFFQFHFNESLAFQFLGFITILLPLGIIQIGQYYSNDLLYLFRRHWLIKTFAYSLMTYLILGWGVMKAEEFIYFQF